MYFCIKKESSNAAFVLCSHFPSSISKTYLQIMLSSDKMQTGGPKQHVDLLWYLVQKPRKILDFRWRMQTDLSAGSLLRISHSFVRNILKFCFYLSL